MIFYAMIVWGIRW